MKIYNVQNIIPANTVMNATLMSVALQLEMMYGYAIQIFFTGTPTGSFKLQSSCDPVTKQNLTVGANGIISYSATNWTDIANSTFTVAAAGNVEWNYGLLDGGNYVRVVYTDTSGGTSAAVIASATFNGKGT
jgi:hypothetical protein